MQISPRARRLAAAFGAVTAALAVTATTLQAPAQANPNHIDPAALERGAAPKVARLVGDTIRDGDLSIPVAKAHGHLDLWTTARGYVVIDNLPYQTQPFRITTVKRTGERTVIARPDFVSGSAVSPRGTRLAWSNRVGDLGTRTVVKVVDPNTGAVKGRRIFKNADVVAVTGSRVLLTRSRKGDNTTTAWWNYERNTVREIATRLAERADLKHDLVVFASTKNPEGCGWVSRLSDPTDTIRRFCRFTPHAWSPDGKRVLSTHTYFDYPGTDRWLVKNARTAEVIAAYNGRLDWDVAWEDNGHFLTMAQSDEGKAAVIRCTPTGECERASRIWDRAIDLDAYYVAPPVVLSSN